MTPPVALQLVTIVVLLALGGVLWRSLRPSLPVVATPAPPAGHVADRPADVSRREFDQVALRVEQLAILVSSLPGLWAEEADRANRAAEREAKSARRNRARDEREAPEPELELSPDDAGTGPGSGVLPMRQTVGRDDPQARVDLSAIRRAIANMPLK